ncbi:extracellular solute-binding protein [Undibacterium sp. Ji83W]|uniref:extracellular solute-binding protein n=1 Tax=Undibacterium sp. Ji83W TaxID=3413043 RepID=UPI003BF3980D
MLATLLICSTSFSVQSAELSFVSFGGALQAAQREAFLVPYTKATATKVTDKNWDGGIGKLSMRSQLGTHDWDVVQVEGEDFILGSRAGMFQKLNWQNLGGKEKYIPQAVADDGVGAIFYSIVLSYDKSRFQTEPKSWADFFNLKKFPGKRALRKTAKTTLEIALLADGVAPHDVYKILATPVGQARAFNKLDQIKLSIIWWEAGTKPVDLLMNKEISMASAYNGRIAAAQQKGADNLAIQWVNNLAMMDWYVIMKGGKNQETAHHFLSYINTSEVQGNLPKLIPYGVSRLDVMKRYSTDAYRNLPTHPVNVQTSLKIDDKFWVEYGEKLERLFVSYASLY